VSIPALLEEIRGLDGYALSTSAEALPRVLGEARDAGIPFRVASWFRGFRPTRSRFPLESWEPVLYVPARRIVLEAPPLDSLVYALRVRKTEPARVMGAKPAPFWGWIFRLLAARPGDTFLDLFPGTGAGARAWRILEEKGRP
jgi:hypothetical protein